MGAGRVCLNCSRSPAHYGGIYFFQIPSPDARQPKPRGALATLSLGIALAYFFSVSSFSSRWFLRLWWHVTTMMTTSIRISSPPAAAPTMIISMFSLSRASADSVEKKRRDGGWGWGAGIRGGYPRRLSFSFSLSPMSTALSSTCQANLYHRVGHAHVVLRLAAVGASVRRGQRSSESQRSVWVGGHTFWQLSTHSANMVASQSLGLLWNTA